MPRQKAFTLIEILVVVAIISILASVILVGLGPARQLGRDARRIADIRETQNALELYYDKCGHYPGAAQSGTTCGAFTGSPSQWGTQGSVGTLYDSLVNSNLGVGVMPVDPNPLTPYVYYASATGNSYVLGAHLEDQSNPILPVSLQGQPISGMPFTCGVAAQIYCVQL